MQLGKPIRSLSINSGKSPICSSGADSNPVPDIPLDVGGNCKRESGDLGVFLTHHLRCVKEVTGYQAAR